MGKSPIATCLLMSLFLSVPAADKPRGDSPDPWLGLHENQLVMQLGKPRKVKQSRAGRKILLFEYGGDIRTVIDQGPIIALPTEESSAGHYLSGDSHRAYSDRRTGPINAETIKVFLDDQGFVEKYKIKGQPPVSKKNP